MVNKAIRTIHYEIGANGGRVTVDYDNIDFMLGLGNTEVETVELATMGEPKIDFKPAILAVLGLVGLAAIGYPFIPVGL